MALRRNVLSVIQKAAYSSRVPPTELYEFVPADQKDFNSMVDLCLSDFLKIEPHTRALNMQPEESKTLFEWIIGKALHYPYSMKICDKKTGKMIGLRTMTIGNRDRSLDWQPFDIESVKMTPKVERLGELLERSKENFWKIIPQDVQKVLRREITFVTEEHQRKGIARHLLHLGLDFEDLKRKGFHGIVSEASSLANQTLLSNNGYNCLYKIENELKMDDGTTGIKVMFKDLRL